MTDVATQFRDWIVSEFKVDPGPVIADGRWHRFNPGDTRHKSSKPGRYLVHADGKANGIFMDWRDGGARHKWFAGGVVQSVDRDEINRQRDARRIEQERVFQYAADEAANFWRNHCTRINDGVHPYLAVKGVQPCGTRQGSGEHFGLGNRPCVIVPIVSPDGTALSLQAIREDGERRFWPGSTKEGGHFAIGKDDGQGPVIFCEGFSTGATIWEATNCLTIVCLEAGNMTHVARWASHKYAGRRMVVAGDDDWHLLDHPKIQANLGKQAAEKMARTLGGVAVFPNMMGVVTDGGDDFNDMAREIGIEDVADLLKGAPDPIPAVPGDTTDSPLPLEWFSDIHAQLEANWLVEDLVPAGGLCLVYGHPGCGKSFFALDLTMHIAAGRAWRGRDAVAGLIIYVGAEGQRGLRQRISAFRQYHGATDLPFALIPVEVNMLEADGDRKKLADTIRTASARFDLPVAAIVFDTLSRTFGGGDEVGTDMVSYVNNVGSLQHEFGCAGVVIHHRPKDSANETPRGHGSLWGACDTIILVEDKNGQKTARVTKQKDAEPADPIDFDLHVVELGKDEKGRDVTSCVVVEPKGDRAAASPTSGFKFTDQQKICLNILYDHVEKQGVFQSHDVPDHLLPKGKTTKVADLSGWGVRTGEALSGPDTTPDSAQRYWRRYRDRFQALNIIGVYENWVWVIRDLRTGADR